jgi:hypothetical protein
MKDIEIIQNGERIGTIHFNQDGSCSTGGSIGKFNFTDAREMLLHLTGFDIHFSDLCF